MYVSLSWLKDFVDIPKTLDPKNLATQLTLKTAEVDGVSSPGRGLEGVVVGEIMEIKKHPNADKLNLAKVDIGKDKPINLIFGQMVVMTVGARVPVAVAPTTLPTGIKIEKKEMRGEPSEGMLCLDQELGLEKEGVTIQYFPDKKPGTPLAEAMGLTDTILEFDNKALTHRPDLWGHYGIAREIAAITGGKLKPLNPKVKIPSKGEKLELKIEDFSLCPRYCGLIINNLKIEESPDWLKARLKAVGHGTHNNIVDITNYVMAELGQPMHAFDKSFIKKGIVVRCAKKHEKITGLDGKIRELDEHMLVIADHEKPVAIAGVMGGENSEITPDTTSIILESANFNASSVRRTSTKLGLRTDAVQRFEKALDPHLAELAIKRAAELILQICPGAEIAGPIADEKKFSNKPVKLILDTEKAASKIGADLSPTEMKKILESLEFHVVPHDKANGKTFEVTVPTFRATKDVDIEDDLIEELARMYGYDNIAPSLPELPSKLPEENIERFKKHRAREILSHGLGFDEVYNYSFYGTSEIANCLLKEEGHIRLLNYLSADQTHMRTSLVPNLLKNIQLNINNFSQQNIYEIGHTYKEIDRYFPLEEKRITGAIVRKGKSDTPFYEAKGAIETLLKTFAIEQLDTVNEVKDAPYAHPIKAMSYLDHNAQTLARVFVLHPSVAKNHDLQDFSIAIFDLNFTELMKLAPLERKYKRIPRFPSIEIDISVLVNKTLAVAAIKEAIEKADTDLIAETELFDIYEGQGIEPDKKAVAFKITLCAPDRTLTDEEMSATQKKIFKNLESLGGKIRGA